MTHPFLGVTLRVPSTRRAHGPSSTLASWHDPAPRPGQGEVWLRPGSLAPPASKPRLRHHPHRWASRVNYLSSFSQQRLPKAGAMGRLSCLLSKQREAYKSPWQRGPCTLQAAPVQLSMDAGSRSARLLAILLLLGLCALTGAQKPGKPRPGSLTAVEHSDQRVWEASSPWAPTPSRLPPPPKPWSLVSSPRWVSIHVSFPQREKADDALT